MTGYSSSLSYYVHSSSDFASPLKLEKLLSEVTVDAFFLEVVPVLRNQDYNNQLVPIRFVMFEKDHVYITLLKQTKWN